MSGACKVCARQVGVDVYDLCIVVVVVVTIAVTTVVGVVVVVVAVSSSCRVMVVVLLKTPIGVSPPPHQLLPCGLVRASGWRGLSW